MALKACCVILFFVQQEHFCPSLIFVLIYVYSAHSVYEMVLFIVYTDSMMKNVYPLFAYSRATNAFYISVSNNKSILYVDVFMNVQ